MSDTPQRPIMVPSSRIVGGDEVKRTLERVARSKYDGQGKRVRPPGDVMGDAMTRAEAVEHLGEAALVVGEKVYGQLATETQEFLQQMEAVLMQKIENEFARRSLRGRGRAALAWLRETAFGGYLIELGVLAPVVVPEIVQETDAPTVPDAEPGPLQWLEFESFGNEAIDWAESGGIVIQPKKRAGMGGRIVARNTDTLRRACAAIGGENAIPDGAVAAALDEEFLMRARRLITEGVAP